MFEILFPIIVENALMNKQNINIFIQKARNVGITTFLAEYQKTLIKRSYACKFFTFNSANAINVHTKHFYHDECETVASIQNYKLINSCNPFNYDFVVFDEIEYMKFVDVERIVNNLHRINVFLSTPTSGNYSTLNLLKEKYSKVDNFSFLLTTKINSNLIISNKII